MLLAKVPRLSDPQSQSILFFIPAYKSKALRDEESNGIEGDITLTELNYVLFKKMKGTSKPGIDGFTVNWLRKLWDSLKLVTSNAINECYRDGSLTPPLRTGIIRLLRKGQKDPTLSGNYRPISIHYKLASCCITQGLRPLVGRVIGQQQKTNVPGNVIGSYIINILNLICQLQENRILDHAHRFHKGIRLTLPQIYR